MTEMNGHGITWVAVQEGRQGASLGVELLPVNIYHMSYIRHVFGKFYLDGNIDLW